MKQFMSKRISQATRPKKSTSVRKSQQSKLAVKQPEQKKEEPKQVLHIDEQLIRLLQKNPQQRNYKDIEHMSEELQKVQFFINLIQQYEKQTFFNCCLKIRYMQLEKEKILFKLGQVGDNFYIILKGSIAIYIKNNKKKEEIEEEQQKEQQLQQMQMRKRQSRVSQIQQKTMMERLYPNMFKVAVLKQGASFGELALLQPDLGVRMATAVTEEHTELAYLRKDDYQSILKEKEEQKQLIHINYFQSMPIFKDRINYKNAQKLFMHTKIQTFLKNQVLYNQMDMEDNMYFIIYGIFEITKNEYYTEHDMNNRPFNMQCLPSTCKLNLGKLIKKEINIGQIGENQIIGHEELYLSCPRLYTLKCISKEGAAYYMDKKNFKIFANEGYFKNTVIQQLQSISRHHKSIEENNMEVYKSHKNLIGQDLMIKNRFNNTSQEFMKEQIRKKYQQKTLSEISPKYFFNFKENIKDNFNQSRVFDFYPQNKNFQEENKKAKTAKSFQKSVVHFQNATSTSSVNENNNINNNKKKSILSKSALHNFHSPQQQQTEAGNSIENSNTNNIVIMNQSSFQNKQKKKKKKHKSSFLEPEDNSNNNISKQQQQINIMESLSPKRVEKPNIIFQQFKDLHLKVEESKKQYIQYMHSPQRNLALLSQQSQIDNGKTFFNSTSSVTSSGENFVRQMSKSTNQYSSGSNLFQFSSGRKSYNYGSNQDNIKGDQTLSLNSSPGKNNLLFVNSNQENNNNKEEEEEDIDNQEGDGGLIKDFLQENQLTIPVPQFEKINQDNDDNNQKQKSRILQKKRQNIKNISSNISSGRQSITQRGQQQQSTIIINKNNQKNNTDSNNNSKQQVYNGSKINTPSQSYLNLENINNNKGNSSSKPQPRQSNNTCNYYTQQQISLNQIKSHNSLLDQQQQNENNNPSNILNQTQQQKQLPSIVNKHQSQQDIELQQQQQQQSNQKEENYFRRTMLKKPTIKKPNLQLIDQYSGNGKVKQQEHLTPDVVVLINRQRLKNNRKQQINNLYDKTVLQNKANKFQILNGFFQRALKAKMNKKQYKNLDNITLDMIIKHRHGGGMNSKINKNNNNRQNYCTSNSSNKNRQYYNKTYNTSVNNSNNNNGELIINTQNN